jgi:hypothetical protein
MDKKDPGAAGLAIVGGALLFFAILAASTGIGNGVTTKELLLPVLLALCIMTAWQTGITSKWTIGVVMLTGVAAWFL